MKRFYCEHCGAEVNEQDEVCSSCGAIFVAIKCPRCGYRDKQHRFSDGCPQCGFLSRRATSTEMWKDSGRMARSSTAHRPLPSWLFWVILTGLGASFLVLAQIYARL